MYDARGKRKRDLTKETNDKNDKKAPEGDNEEEEEEEEEEVFGSAKLNPASDKVLLLFPNLLFPLSDHCSRCSIFVECRQLKWVIAHGLLHMQQLNSNK